MQVVRLGDFDWSAAEFTTAGSGDAFSFNKTFEFFVPHLCVADVSAAIGSGSPSSPLYVYDTPESGGAQWFIRRVSSFIGSAVRIPEALSHYVFDPNAAVPGNRLLPETWRLVGPGKFRVVVYSQSLGVGSYFAALSLRLSPAVPMSVCDFDAIAQSGYITPLSRNTA